MVRNSSHSICRGRGESQSEGTRTGTPGSGNGEGMGLGRDGVLTMLGLCPLLLGTLSPFISPAEEVGRGQPISGGLQGTNRASQINEASED